jgi:hypothetical protein
LDNLSESSCALAPVFSCALVKKDDSINVISKNALSRILLFFLSPFFMHANRSKGRIVTNNNFIIYSFGLMGAESMHIHKGYNRIQGLKKAAAWHALIKVTLGVWRKLK